MKLLGSFLILVVQFLSATAFAQTDTAQLLLSNETAGSQLNLSKAVTRPLYRVEQYQGTCSTSQIHMEPCGFVNPYSFFLPTGSQLLNATCNCNSYSNWNGRYQCFNYITYLTYSCLQERTVQYGEELLYTNGVAAQVSVSGKLPSGGVKVDATINEANELKLSCYNDEYIVTENRNLSTAPIDAQKTILTTGGISFSVQKASEIFGSFNGHLESAALQENLLVIKVKKNGISQAPSIAHLKLSYDGLFGREVITFNALILPNTYSVSTEGDSLVYSIDLDQIDVKFRKIDRKKSYVTLRFSGAQLLPENTVNTLDSLNSGLNRNVNTRVIAK